MFENREKFIADAKQQSLRCTEAILRLEMDETEAREALWKSGQPEEEILRLLYK